MALIYQITFWFNGGIFAIVALFYQDSTAPQVKQLPGLISIGLIFLALFYNILIREATKGIQSVATPIS